LTLGNQGKQKGFQDTVALKWGRTARHKSFINALEFAIVGNQVETSVFFIDLLNP